MRRVVLRSTRFGLLATVWLTFAMMAAVPSAAAPGRDILFGTDGTNLIRIDAETGAGTVVGPLTGGSAPIVSALAGNPLTGILYAGGGGGAPEIYTVDPGTGMLTLLGNTGLGSASIMALDFDRTGVLYAAVDLAGGLGSGADHLAVINKTTGMATIVGPFGSCTGVAVPTAGGGSCTIEGLDALAFDAAGALWGKGPAGAGTHGIFRINSGTGAASLVSQLTDEAGNPENGLESFQFACEGRLLGGTAGLSARRGFVRNLDPITGQLTVRGTGRATLGNLAALAFLAPCVTGPVLSPIVFSADDSLGILAPTGTVVFDTDPISGGSPFGPGRTLTVHSNVTEGGINVRVFDFQSIEIPPGTEIRGVGSGPLILTSGGDIVVDGTFQLSGEPGQTNDDGGGGGGGAGGALALFAQGQVKVGSSGKILLQGGNGGAGMQGSSGDAAALENANGAGGLGATGGGRGGNGGEPFAGGNGGAGGTGGGTGLGGSGGGGGGFGGGQGPPGFTDEKVKAFRRPEAGGVGATGKCPDKNNPNRFSKGGNGGRGPFKTAPTPSTVPAHGGLGGQTEGAAGLIGLVMGDGGGGGASGFVGGGGGPGMQGSTGNGGGGGGGGGDGCEGALGKGNVGGPGGGGDAGAGVGGTDGALIKAPAGKSQVRGLTDELPEPQAMGGAGGGGAVALGSAAGPTVIDGTISLQGGESDAIPGSEGGTGPAFVFGALSGRGDILGIIHLSRGLNAAEWYVSGGGGGGGASGPGKVFHEPPLCSLTASRPGPPAEIEVTAQDFQSGLASISILHKDNADVKVPPFPSGTLSPVVVTATKEDPTRRSVVELAVFDVAGNVTFCDPVIVLVVRERGQPETETFSGIPQAESKIQVLNGVPGIGNLVVTVNGVRFRLPHLSNGEERNLDVSAAMRPGNGNVITLTATGKPGGSATVVIHD